MRQVVTALDRQGEAVTTCRLLSEVRAQLVEADLPLARRILDLQMTPDLQRDVGVLGRFMQVNH